MFTVGQAEFLKVLVVLETTKTLASESAVADGQRSQVRELLQVDAKEFW